MPVALHTIRDLKRLTGVEPRTVRHWIARGLVASPLGRGPGARYTDDHVARIRAVARLRRELRSLRKVRARLAALSPAELEALATPPPPRAPDAVPPPPPAPSYPGQPFEYVELMPGLGLLIDARGGELLRRVADEIYRHYALARAATGARSGPL